MNTVLSARLLSSYLTPLHFFPHFHQLSYSGCRSIYRFLPLPPFTLESVSGLIGGKVCIVGRMKEQAVDLSTVIRVHSFAGSNRLAARFVGFVIITC